MTKAVAELPDDVDALKAMIVAMADQRALLEARNSHLEVATKTADERIATLTAIVRMLERSRYGTRSERLRGETLSEMEPALVVIDEHPEWQKPLFEALDRRGVAYAAFDLKQAAFINTAPPAARRDIELRVRANRDRHGGD